MATPACRRCGWHLAPSDLFCAFCGKEQRRIEVEPPVVTVGMAEDEPHAGATLRPGETVIRNRGEQEVAVLGITLPRGLEWTLEPPPAAESGELVLGPGQSASLRITGNPAAVEASLVTSEIATSIGTWVLPVRQEPLPSVRVEPETIPIRPSGTSEVELRLSLAEGREELALDVEGGGLSLISPRASILLVEDQVQPVRIAVDGSAALEGGEHALIARLGGDLRLRVSLRFMEAAPGRLQPEDGRDHLDIRVFPGDEVSSELPIVNAGQFHFTLEDVSLDLDPGVELDGVELSLFSTGTGLRIERPVTIEPGEGLTLAIHCRAGASPGRRVDTTLRLSGHGGQPLLLPLRIDTREPAEHHRQYVGFDFGTSVSSVATRRQLGNGPGVAPVAFSRGLDGERPYLPSDVKLLRGSGQTVVKELDWSSVDGMHAARKDVRQLTVAQNLKRRLGSRDEQVRLESVFFDGHRVDIEVEELAAFVAEEMRRGAERTLDARILNTVVTYPTRFSLRRIDAIRRVFERLGLEHVWLMDEATAAGILSMYGQFRDRDDYSMLVYDMGGGTTDVTLFQVENRKTAKVLEIRPRVLGVTGNPAMGGRDLTDIMVRKVLQELSPSDRKRIPLPGRPHASEERAQLARRNQALLFNAVERLKRQIFAQPEDPKPSELHASLFTDRRELRPLPSVVFDPVALQDELRPQVEPLWKEIEELIDLSEIDQLDILLLVGRSSKLPLIRQELPEYLGERFPRLEVVSPEWGGQVVLKEAVALGACLAQELRTGFDERLVLDNLDDRSASRFGLRNQRGQFIELLPRGARFGEPSAERRLPISTPFRSDTYELRLEIWENPTLDPRVDGNPEAELVGIAELRFDGADVDPTGQEEAGVRLLVDEDRRMKVLAAFQGVEKEIDVQ